MVFPPYDIQKKVKGNPPYNMWKRDKVFPINECANSLFTLWHPKKKDKVLNTPMKKG